MRATRATSVTEAERRNHSIASNSSYSRQPADCCPERPSLRRQERLSSECCGADALSSGNVRPTKSAVPSVLFTSSCGLLTTANAPDMNTLAAQTVAAGGSSYSINTAGHCECRHTRADRYHSPNNDNGDDDVFSSSLGSLRAKQEMRWELRYFFMNPYLKYKKRGRKPWKLSIQLLKIILVTIQLIFFGTSQFSLTQFYEGNKETFEHIFLKNWIADYDSQAYPHSNELYALYQQKDFYSHIDHVANQFANLKSMAIGTYEFDQPDGEVRKLHVWQENYADVKIMADGHFHINQSTHVDSLIIPVYANRNISVKDYLDRHNQTINFDTLREFRVNLMLSSVHLKDSETFTIPDCIRFNITIEYNNREHSGRVPVTLDAVHSFIDSCSNATRDNDDLDSGRAKMTIFLDSFVAFLCIMSALMCIRSVVKAQALKVKTVKFFKAHFDTKLSKTDQMEFLNFWYILIIVSDACTIAGSMCKIMIESRQNTDYDTCSLLLGTGCFLVWFGVLRYLGFFNKYNILIVTLKNAMPNVLRFLLCGGIIYAAYAFFGWIVLGPYHPKFRTLEISVECMFSLVNGDDMYATFREMSDRNQTIYIFSKFYLFTFISLFIYVVLSLIIAIIMDTYETMKEYQRTGFVEGMLHTFMGETCDEDIPGRGSFHTQSSMMEKWLLRQKLRNACSLCCCRCRSRDDDDDDSLIS